MMAERSDAPWRSSDELLVLHAVRLAGFADDEAVTDRVDSPTVAIGDTLRDLTVRGLIEHMSFADTGGWILTEAGKLRDGELLALELQASGSGPVLRSTIEDFESSANARLVTVVTDWQLQSATERSDSAVEVMRELTALADELTTLMTGLVEQLPRFGRYPRQFSAAVARARAGDHEWVAGVGRLSGHTVWAELHQDLLSSLGRGRSAER